MEPTLDDVLARIAARAEGGGLLRVTDEERAAIDAAVKREDDDLAARIPDEQAALRLLADVHRRLKQLGWNDPIYCPKDGSPLDVIEIGSTGIHRARYEGEWPKGGWWIEDAGDLWPSRPTMARTAREPHDEEPRP